MFFKSKLFIKNFILLLAPLVLCITLSISSIYINFDTYIQNSIKENNSNILQQSKNTMEIILNELDTIQVTFGINPSIHITLKDIVKTGRATLEKYSIFNTVKDFLNSQTLVSPYLQSIYISFDQKFFISSSDGLCSINNFFDTSWYYASQKQPLSSKTWFEVRTINQPSPKRPTPVITFYSRITSALYNKSEGVIALNLKQNYINDSLNAIQTDSQTFLAILDNHNNIIAQNNHLNPLTFLNIRELDSLKEQNINFMEMGDGLIFSQIVYPEYNLRFISVTPKNALYHSLYMTRNIFIGLLILLILITFAITYTFMAKTYKQINYIISAINNATSSAAPLLPEGVKTEYDYIMHTILSTFVEKRNLEHQLLLRKYELKSSELLSLQAQINPHFLYNTLEVINLKVLGLARAPNEINYMIECLSDILKYSLSNPTEQVTLQEEIKYAQLYIDILKIRYKDKFDVKWAYAPDILPLYVAKLILQPLIENAVYHGIKEKQGFGTIKIKLFTRSNFIHIYVIDNGKGISLKTLDLLKINLNRSECFEHIGLYNINKRLSLIYNESHAFTIRSKEHKGTCISIQIPYTATY